jgi:hypothetical protein
VALHEVLAAALNLGGGGGGDSQLIGGGSIVALGGGDSQSHAAAPRCQHPASGAERDALGVDGRLVLLKCAATLIG